MPKKKEGVKLNVETPAVPRLNKLYFEPVGVLPPSSTNAKPGAVKTRYEWNLRGTNGHVIGASHITFATKIAAVRNCISVMGKETFEKGRVNVVDPVMRGMIIDEISKAQ